MKSNFADRLIRSFIAQTFKNKKSNFILTSVGNWEHMQIFPNQKIKSSLYSPYYAEACNEWRGPSPRLSAWATQLRRNVATVASRWRHCVDLTGPGVEPQTSRTDSVRFAIELTTGCRSFLMAKIQLRKLADFFTPKTYLAHLF